MPRAVVNWIVGGTLSISALGAKEIRSEQALVSALAEAAPGTVVELPEGRIELSKPLVIGPGVWLRGAGMDKTILAGTATWAGNPESLPDPETRHERFDRTGYLIHLEDKAADIRISHLTLTGPRLHGAIFGWGNRDLEVEHVRIDDFLYSGIRTYSTSHASIHDCVFVDAGQRWEKGKPGLKGGITGGGIFAIWIKDSEIFNNRFLRTKTAPNEHYYGIKGRQGKRVRIHHNTIETNFSIEFPFENDEDVEIDHNVLHGTVSIPKHAGGPVPESGRTFHLHHNLFKDTYAIEFVRNGVEIDHNLFDFDPAKDHGNLISSFGKAPMKGPASFHHNLVRNPGRGVIWLNEPTARLKIHNNHIIASTTATPREEGLFGFHPNSDFESIAIQDNLIECNGTPRSLVRNKESRSIRIENNGLKGVLADGIVNPQADQVQGLDEPLSFRCGVNGEVEVEGWEARSVSQR